MVFTFYKKRLISYMKIKMTEQNTVCGEDSIVSTKAFTHFVSDHATVKLISLKSFTYTV